MRFPGRIRRPLSSFQNLIRNRKLLVGLAVAVLIAVAIVLLVSYSGGGHGSGGGY